MFAQYFQHSFTRNACFLIYIDDLWLSALWCKTGCKKASKVGVAGQNKLQTLLFCQRPNHTHNTQSLQYFVSSLQNQKKSLGHNIEPWSLVLPRTQFHFHTINKPPRNKIAKDWPLHWLRSQNIRPEEWAWDVITKQKPTPHWELARTPRAPMMEYIEPLKGRGIAPQHIRVAPDTSALGSLPALPHTPVPQLEHSQILHTVAQQHFGLI